MSCIQCKKGFGSTCFETHEGFIAHEVELAAEALREDVPFEMTLQGSRVFDNPTNMDPDRYAIKLHNALKRMQPPASDMADAMRYAGAVIGRMGNKVRKPSGS